MNRQPHGPGVIVAVDCPDADAAESLVARLDPGLCRLKIGSELFTRAGPALVERWQARGFELFLDLKFHDIPNTVAAACRTAAELGVWMVNVHALGGRRMIEAAREALDARSQPPLLIAVTVLTSMDARDLAEIGLEARPDALASRLAVLADDGGCDGVVCSAREAGALRAAHGPGFCLVTPGIRPADAERDDQRRTMTPAEAAGAGADHLVVGRPVTAAADPAQRVRAIREEFVRARES